MTTCSEALETLLTVTQTLVKTIDGMLETQTAQRWQIAALRAEIARIKDEIVDLNPKGSIATDVYNSLADASQKLQRDHLIRHAEKTKRSAASDPTKWAIGYSEGFEAGRFVGIGDAMDTRESASGISQQQREHTQPNQSQPK